MKKIFCSVLLLFLISQSFSQKVGLLMDSYVLERWFIDQKLFSNKITELGGEVLVEVPFGDPNEQIRLGNKLLEAGVDVLVVIPTDGKKAAQIVTAAKKKGIPVLAYDRLILSKELDFYISFNNEKVGNLQASYVVQRVPKGKYLLINGPTSDNNAVLFRKGQLEVLKPYVDRGDIEIIGDFVLNDWSEIEAFMIMEEFLSSGKGSPDVIIAGNDALATGTLDALPEELREKTLITGQDAELFAIKHIISGKQTMTVYKPIKSIAQHAAEIAMKLAKGEKVEYNHILQGDDYNAPSLLLDPVVVDKSNYKETVVKDGHVELSNVMESK